MMALPQQGRRIVRLVRLLTTTALLAVVATVGLVGWTLANARAERNRATAEQAILMRASDNLRQHVVAGCAEIRALLEETSPITGREFAVSKLVQFVATELRTIPNPDLRPPLVQLQTLTDHLADLARRSELWRTSYTVIWTDILKQQTIGRVRDLITRLRSDVDTLDGRHRLQDAVKFNQWRTAAGDDAARRATALLNEHARRQSLGTSDFNSQLAELARLVELLGGEETFDDLADLKDDQLKPALDRLSDSITSLSQDPDSPATLTPRAVEDLRIAIFGQGYTSDDAHQDAQPGRGGLYALRRDALQLRRDREKLKAELTSLAQDIEAANATFAQSAQNRTEELTRQTEDSLRSILSHMIVASAVCLVLFLWLALLISRGIHHQVKQLDEARAEAESGRQTTQKLMLDQQAAAKQLASAHKGLQASEQRFRMLSAAAPLGICECDAGGRLVYANSQWEKIAGMNLAESAGNGWERALHPDDLHVSADWKRAADKGEDFLREFRFCTPDGDIRWVSARTTPIRSEAGVILGHVATVENITQRKNAEAALEDVNKKLQDTSRQAGMAEIATGVLHNVGNVLNSVNISSSIVSDRMKKSRISHLAKAVGLIRDHQADLANFVTIDPTGKQLPAFLTQLADHLNDEQSAILKELAHLQKNIEHIKEIVSTQQAYASLAGLSEMIDLREMLEDALRIHRAAILRHDINVIREFADAPRVLADKHKILQIFVNLLSNAKHAMKEAAVKNLTLKIESTADRVRASIQDTGCGIHPENLIRIFAHGFTTKKEGHGFGLHSGALAAKQMGGDLRVTSQGPGHGAVFILELPLKIPAPAAAA